MNSEMFIKAVKRHVRDAAIEDTIENLINPPGRKYAKEHKCISDWYKGLEETHREYVNSIICAAVHQALFGIMSVIDGVRTIDDQGGRFELAFIGDQRITLNAPGEIGLHELLNASD